MFKRIECVVSAERVGYNYLLWISKTAIGLGLKGISFIRNDGSIEIIAEGEDEILTKLINKIRKGHPVLHMFVTIDNLSVKWHEPRNEFKDFSVKIDKD